jgi:phospholipid/cholesterol/gamma-HCH transport system substrate-binding protein
MAGYARGRNVMTVGMFAIVATIAFTFLFLHMTGRGLSIRRSDLYVRLPSAEGLRKGDRVFFRGVDVGEVTKLVFAPEGHVLVKARLLEPVPVTEDGHATLVALDIFGGQSLVLHQGDFRAAALADGDTLIGTAPANMTVRMAELGRNAERLTGDTTTMLLHAALGGMGEATQSMALLGAEMRQLIAAQQESLALLTRNSAQVAHNLQLATDSAAIAGLRDRALSTTESLGRAAGDLEKTAASLASVVGALDNGAGSAGALLRDRALYDRTESLLANMEALVIDLKANPKRYINLKVF